MGRSNRPITLGYVVNPGDLAIWRYSIPHEVGDVIAKNKEKGFLRVIFPQFDTYNKAETAVKMRCHLPIQSNLKNIC